MKHASWDGRSVSDAVRYALLVSAFATLAVTNHARAADAAADAAADNETAGTLQEVVVTGSLIKRTDFDTPSPVQVISAESITQAGYTSVAQVLSNLSANGQGSLTAANPEAFATGGSGIALRGLTVGSTLTLIDGERMVAYPISDDGERSFVDTQSIPLLAVERIDVLKDGASAEYGSDAIAGVVNIVLKKNYQGFETSAEAGTTNHSDGTSERIGFIAGIGDLGGDGYNAYLAVEWRHQDEILTVNRTGSAWDRTNWIPEGGTNATVGAGSTWANFQTLNSFPVASGPYLVPGSATSFQSPGVVFLSPACPSAAALAADQCTFYNAGTDRQQIQPQTGNLNIIGRVTKALGDNWQAVLTSSLFRSEGEQVFTPPNTEPVAGAPGAPFSFPFYGPGFLGQTTPVTLTIPTTNPMNKSGVPLFPVGLLTEFGSSTNTEVVTNTYRDYLDFSGKEFGWDLDAQLGIMYANTSATYNGNINYTALQNAFNNGYVLGTGGALAAGVSTAVVSHFTNSLQVADVHATRTLFDLPGGPLGFGVGLGWNHRYLNAVQSPDAADGFYAGINDAFAFGGQTDASAYAELEAPIVKGLEVDAAGRYDHYNNTGGVTVPKFGAKWSPLSTFTGEDNKLVTFRGTYGKGFRAPNPAEYRSAGSLFGLGAFADGSLCPSSNANPSLPQYGLNQVQANPQPGDVAQYCDFNPAFLQVTNPNLKPERSTNFTWGAIFEPINDVSLSMDFWNIVIENLIVNPAEFGALPFPPEVANNIRSGPVTLPQLQPGGGVANVLFPQGVPIDSTAGYENAGKIHVDGIDLDLAGHFDLGAFGKISPALTWSHEIVWNISNCYPSTNCVEAHLAGTHGPFGISGDTGNPRDRGVLTFAWDYGPVDVTWTVNYTGPFNLTDPSDGIDDCATAINIISSAKFANGVIPPGFCVVKSFTYVNLFAGYKVTPNLQVFGSILNLFNAAPPVDLSTYGNGGFLSSSVAYDPAFAQQGAIGMFFDLGFKWKL
jgi:iron complex outermembrane receptor protein